ncbi:Dolichyldiphosphatase 1 [Lunasporangiospora selenospora]|uniref:Dolichyldiphosphatase n=1 Tax=Lunasporangiospora selenospora TaxID=979761 RepID=A0A9P6KFK5_9FUNG|nr:Dolichyldiphosphatase 1 [Lunasporangiospora selenospora]
MTLLIRSLVAVEMKRSTERKGLYSSLALAVGVGAVSGSDPAIPVKAAEAVHSKIPPHHTLTSLSITHVQFAQDDILSKLFAYVTLSPLAIVCGYAAVILTSRDIKPAIMFAGQLANEVVNQILKRLVRQARPTDYLGDGYGMPSSHSQFMAYFATYTAILMYRRGLAPGAMMPHVVSGLVTVWALLVVYSRVHLYYHTWQQVVAGTICGIVFATSYYLCVDKILRPRGLFTWLLEHPLAKIFYVRDTDSIPDMAKFDWEMWQQYSNSKGTHPKIN